LVLKRILILSRFDIKNPKSGGAQYVVHRIAKHLAQKGHETYLLCSSFPNAKKCEELDGVKIIRSGSQYMLPVTGCMFLLKNSRKKPDLIIEEINIIPWLVPLYSKIPEIAFIHQTQTQQIKSSQSSALSQEINRVGRIIIIFLEKLIPIFYKKINFVTVSNTIKNDLISLGIKKHAIHVIEPGIDKIKEEIQIKKNTHPTILYLGRLKKYKGVQFLLESLREVIKAIPDVELKIVGNGNYETELKEMVLNYSLQSNVRFLGYLSENEKYKTIQSSWFLAIASLNEGWCVPVIEAGALGVPSIAFANGGLNDSIIDNKTGLLVESENIMELTKKIIGLLQNEGQRIRLGENAKKFSSQFLWEKQLKKFYKIIASLE